MQRQVEIIGAAWGLGGADPGCADAPAALAPLLSARLAACGRPPLPGPILKPLGKERRKQVAISRLCGLLGSAVADALRHGRLPCVLGGDHSCAGGTWTGVARSLREEGGGSLGLVWVDAHMDSHTPRTSPTGRLHGMPLAWLLGQDDDPLYGLATGVLEPRHVCLVGVRSFEAEEEARLAALGVRVFDMSEVGSRGLAAVFREALAIASAGTAGFGVSIDLDALDPGAAPGVGTPVPGGLSPEALAAVLEPLAGLPAFRALEVVEYSPRLDLEGSTARAALDLAFAALCGAKQEAQVFPHAVERDGS